MQPLDSKKRASLVKSITLHGISSALVLAVIFGYIVPAYSEISEKVSGLNELNASYLSLKRDGVDAAGYQLLVSKYANVKKQPGEKTDTAALNKALKKTDTSAEYIDWVKSELSKQSSLDAEIEMNNAIIGGIVPTYSDASQDVKDAFDKNRISLGQLVRFVENDLLKKNNLESFSPIGFGNLTFDSKGNSLVNIGSYKLTLDIKGTNKNLTALVQQIQSSGNLELKNGKLVDPEMKLIAESGSGTSSGQISGSESKLDNLLVSIDTIRFASALDQSDKENRANVTLVLYVRARSYSDFIAIRSILADKIKKLSADITKASEMCADATSGDCKNENIYAATQAIRSIQDSASALSKKVQDALKNSTIRDLNSEFDTLFATYNSYKTLNDLYMKNSAIIENVKKETASSK